MRGNMFYFGKGKLLALGLIASIVAYHQGDKFLNYSLVDASITSVKVDCYIESGNQKLVQKDTGVIAYMDCAKAPIAAIAFNYSDKDVKHRAKVAYQFKSPADGSNQIGEYVDSSAQDGEYSTGKVVQIYANTSNAKVSMWN